MPKNPYVATTIHLPESLKNSIENEARIAGVSPGELFRTIIFLGLSTWCELQAKPQVLKKVRKGLE